MIRSIRKLVIAAFAILLLLGAAAVIFSAYQRTADATLDLSQRLMQTIGSAIIQRTEDIFNAAETQLETNVVIAGSSVASSSGILYYREDWLKLFWRQIHQHDYLSSIYLADTQGNMVQARKAPRPATRIVQQQNEKALEYAVYRAPDYSPVAHIDKPTAYDPRTRPWFPQDQPIASAQR